ncbi:MAG TPA: MarR family transcriptional regulator [Stellaceae bacterium]|nr:MarR family transcriptional regulator [Stellaceae bacterium]
MSEPVRRLLSRSDRESALALESKLELKVWLRLLTSTTLIEHELRRRMRERFETTLARFDLLSQLDRTPRGLTMGELSSRLMVTNGNVTGLTDALVTEGLVSRATEPSDRRSLRITLTAAGKRFFDSMTPVHEEWVDALMSGLTRAEMAHLLELLGKLKQSLAAAGASR